MVYRTSPETQERKDAKRKQIIETAVKVFAARGYHATSVKDIVQEANISVGSFYFYFKSKEDIFETLYDEISKAIFLASGQVIEGDFSVVQRFCRATTASLRFFSSYRELTRILFIEAVGLNPRFEQKRSEMMRLSANRMKTLFDFLIQNNTIDIPDSMVAALAYDGTVLNVVLDWLQNRQTPNLTDFAFPLIIYNLQALKMTFHDDEVKKYIAEFLSEDFPFSL